MADQLRSIRFCLRSSVRCSFCRTPRIGPSLPAPAPALQSLSPALGLTRLLTVSREHMHAHAWLLFSCLTNCVQFAYALFNSLVRQLVGNSQDR